MPRIRRRFILSPAEIGVYHCIKEFGWHYVIDGLVAWRADEI
jgi:hypothetical protein